MNAKPLALPAQATPDERPLELAEVYRAHGDDVIRWAARLLGRTQDAADVGQEVFCVVHRRLPEFSPRQARLSTWLFRITANVVRSRRRRERLYGWLFDPHTAVPDVPYSGPDPAELAEAKADAALVYRVLDALNDRDRSLLLLFELEGYSGEMVAEMLQLSPSTIWVRLHRARKRFLIKLREEDPEAGP